MPHGNKTLQMVQKKPQLRYMFVRWQAFTCCYMQKPVSIKRLRNQSAPANLSKSRTISLNESKNNQSKNQPNHHRYLGHVTGQHPIRDQYLIRFLILDLWIQVIMEVPSHCEEQDIEEAFKANLLKTGDLPTGMSQTLFDLLLSLSPNRCLAPRSHLGALSLENQMGYGRALQPNSVITGEGSVPAANIAPAILPLPRLGSTVGKRLWQRVAMSEFGNWGLTR
eukprot:sb/3469726/